MISLRCPGFVVWLVLGSLLGAPPTGCRRPSGAAFDPADYETPAAEAVLHQVLKDATDARKEAKVGVIVLGEQMMDSTPAFREKFPEASLQWFSSQGLATVWVGPVARVVEKSTQLQPFQLQIFAVSARNDGGQEVIAAWAYEDRMLRRRYLAKPGLDGQWSVQPLDVIDQRGGGASTP